MALAFQQDARLPGGGYWYDDQTGDIDRSGRNSVLAIGLFDFNLTNKPLKNPQTGVWQPSGVTPQPTPADQGERATGPAPGTTGAPAQQPALRTIDVVVGQYAKDHGIPVSPPAKSDEFIKDPNDPLGLKMIPNPNPTFHWTFPDGFALDATLNGEVIRETDPSAARTRANEPVQGPGGTLWRLNPETGQFEQVAPTPGTQGAAVVQTQIEQNEAQTIAALARMGVDNATAERIAKMTPAEVENEVAQGRLTRIQANVALTKLEPEVAQIP